MLAIAHEEALCVLKFVDKLGIEQELERIGQKIKSAIVAGHPFPINSIENELSLYFDGKLKEFTTPLFFLGSTFQEEVWEQLKKIPIGETQSYTQIATAIGRPTACRAVAQANGTNHIAIVIPCHRVINADGKLGGYNGGITRKEWLINHEKHY